MAFLKTLVGAAALLALSIAQAHAAPAVLALTGGRVITVSDGEIDGATILIRDGVIEAVGTDVELPFDAVEIDVTGKTVMPAMIDVATPGGLDRANESLPVTPFLNVYDAVNPASRYYEDALRFGHAVVHVVPGADCVVGGVGRVVRPIGRSIDEMTVAPDTAMVISTSPKRGLDRMAQMATLREAFAEFDDYKQRLAEQRYEKDLEEKGEKIKVGPEEARKRGLDLIEDEHYDNQHFNLMRLLRGDFPAWFYCGQAMDVAPALTVAEAHGLKDGAVFIVGPDAHKVVDQIRDAGRPAVLSPSLFHRERDVMTGELRETFVPAVFDKAGVLFALRPASGGVYAEQYLTYQAAVCVRNGMSRDAAIEAITLSPAKILKLDDRLGSIEAGKSGSVVVFSGDPLDFSSWVEDVYIDGVHAYDRERDHVLQRLLRLERDIDADREQEEQGEAAEAKGGPEASGEGEGEDE